jgi:two-component system chemotaxis sensor kinase CheA
VPLTLAIIEGLVANVGTERYIIPLSVIESCAEVVQPEAWADHERDLLDVQGTLLPLVRLRRFFDVAGSPPQGEIAVIISVDGERFGVVVDAILDSVQAVIKPFGRFVGRSEGLSGTTVFGDGFVIPIIDPGSLLHASGIGLGVAEGDGPMTW